jgi:hypothetical protein
MTPTEAFHQTHKLLDAFGIKGWQVKIVERFTGDWLKDMAGFCELTARTIWLKADELDHNADAWGLITHEVAHCLQPHEQYYDEALAHGPDFERALVEVRKVEWNWQRRCTCYRCQRPEGFSPSYYLRHPELTI